MFVGIIGTDRVYTRTLQCARVGIKPCPGKPDSHVMIEMEGLPDRGKMSIVIDKSTAEVYVMNDSGQTIGSLRWPEQKMAAA